MIATLEMLNPVNGETKTAREMALTAHNLGSTGNVATLPNGHKFVWTEWLALWVRYN